MESFSHLFQQLEKQELEKIKEEINKEEEQDTDVCPHYFTSIEHSFVLCLSCGLELDSFPEEKSIEPSRCYARKIKDKSIYLDIEHLAISERIKDLANEIYIQVCNFSKPRRGLNRKGIIFASIFHAYKLSNNPQSCESLLRIFNIKRKVALKGLKFINENTPPRSPLRTTYITPEHLIQEFMKRFNAGEDEIKKVVDLYKKIKGKVV